MLNEIIFDERYDSEDYGTTTLYFIAPKELLKRFIPTNDYPEAIGMEISIEFPINNIEARHGDVCVSPTMKLEDGGTEETDWYDIDLPYDEIEELINIALN